jgi:uncharacterized membrane protein
MRALLSIALAVSASATGLAGSKTGFARDVKPILEKHCVRCHGARAAMRNLRLDRRPRAMMAIVPGKPEDSRIYYAAKSGFMPPGKTKLTPRELETLRKWIAEGANWPEGVEIASK